MSFKQRLFCIIFQLALSLNWKIQNDDVRLNILAFLQYAVETAQDAKNIQNSVLFLPVGLEIGKKVEKKIFNYMYDTSFWKVCNIVYCVWDHWLVIVFCLLSDWTAVCDDSQIMYGTETTQDEEGKTSEKITVTTTSTTPDKKSKKMTLSKLFRPWKWRKKRKSGGKHQTTQKLCTAHSHSHIIVWNNILFEVVSILQLYSKGYWTETDHPIESKPVLILGFRKTVLVHSEAEVLLKTFENVRIFFIMNSWPSTNVFKITTVGPYFQREWRKIHVHVCTCINADLYNITMTYM